jgi:hypothetical protein
MAQWIESGLFNSKGWCDVSRAIWHAAGYPTLPTSGCFRRIEGYYYYHYEF